LEKQTHKNTKTKISSIDVSTIKELANRWYPSVHVFLPKKSNQHRALPDLFESLNELRFYKKYVFVDNVPPFTEALEDKKEQNANFPKFI